MDGDYMSDILIITPHEFDFQWLKSIPVEHFNRNVPLRERKKMFKNIITAFDIETTKVFLYHKQYISETEYNLLKEHYEAINHDLNASKEDKKKSQEFEANTEIHAVMYRWTWAFGHEVCVQSASWDEFIWFCEQLKSTLTCNEKLCVYDHNLSYEFQFFKGIYQFQDGEIFCIKKRKILKCIFFDCLEFRCSYLHSQMSLDKWTKKLEVTHQKLSGGKFDYSKERYAWTEISDYEMDYMVNDVLGIIECISTEMTKDGDTLGSIPLTSTGYVRRICKKAMKGRHYLIQQLFPDMEIFEMLREEFAGGDTHANRYYVGYELEDVYSDDISSAHPAQQCNREFPMQRFTHISNKVSLEFLENMIYQKHKAVLFRCCISGLKLIDPFFGCPYISVSHCRNVGQETVIDNGRIIQSDYVETTLNDLDFDIIINEYDFEDIVITEMAYSTYAKLPSEFIDTVIYFFKMKTELKDVEGEEYFYNNMKKYLNGIYGMTAQNPVILPWIVDESGDLKIDLENFSISESLAKAKQKAFMVYQWACWTTAWTRWQLHTMMWLVGDDYVYNDTDCIKHFGKYDKEFKEYNQTMKHLSMKNGACAKNKYGETFYMGVFEKDAHYKKFKTLGAKKYCYIDDKDEFHITISGVNKKLGAKELVKAGGMSEFQEGFVFKKSSTDIIYNDVKTPFKVQVPNGEVLITSNAAIVDSTYEMGLTGEYKDLLKDADSFLRLTQKFDIINKRNLYLQ